MNVTQVIAGELSVRTAQVAATIQLLDEGATVPFIARYRKEATGELDDTQLRNLQERLTYLRDLEKRRETIIKSIDEQGKLSEELKQAIVAVDNKTALEDLYLPYKPKRRTKAQIAKEAGLEPLALSLLQSPELDPQAEAAKYLNEEKAINDAAAALEGARHILMESFAENAGLLAHLRDFLWQHGILTSTVVNNKQQEGSKFADYFEYQEAIKKIPSHRALALFRGRNEGILRLSLQLTDAEQEAQCRQFIASQFAIRQGSSEWLWKTVEWTWKIKLHLKLELELMGQLREAAEEEAIRVFKDNLHNLLMMAPAGNRVVMGLDPGLRTGVKVVVVDGTGKLLAYTTIFPHAPRKQWSPSLAVLNQLCQQHGVELVSIGNGTASRETDRLVLELIKQQAELKLTKVVVSEAGASVYSASELAAQEFPDLDVTYRGAVSIARRLQDPLAELVKIDAKSIGVGQYQHDLNQIKLSHGLTAVLEDCVNAVGADVNTASVPLLTSISGLNKRVAENIVTYREQHGRFTNRKHIKKVSGLGEKTFEQAIGFLRIVGGDDPLDASAVHPESYPVVENILSTTKKSIQQLMGDAQTLKALNANDFADERFGLPTIKDILSELNKPGRDPRPEFKTATFQEGIETLNDLKTDMILEGVITNVTNFGAFVDIGVHQDGLVHISKMANQFVSDPHKVVKVGQIVKVKVLEVDIPRNRITLSMQLEGGQASKPSRPEPKEAKAAKAKGTKQKPAKPQGATLGDMFKDVLSKTSD